MDPRILPMFWNLSAYLWGSMEMFMTLVAEGKYAGEKVLSWVLKGHHLALWAWVGHFISVDLLKEKLGVDLISKVNFKINIVL